MASRETTERSDRDLMARVQAGDADSFGKLYDRHSGLALGVALAICRDLGDAEDAVEEGFLGIWRGRMGFRPEVDSFRAWSMVIVMRRASYLAHRTASPAPFPTERSEEEALLSRSRDDLLSSLCLLAIDQAEVIVLATYGDLAPSEIARQLDLPAATVDGRMRSGLGALRDQMKASEAVAGPG